MIMSLPINSRANIIAGLKPRNGVNVAGVNVDLLEILPGAFVVLAPVTGARPATAIQPTHQEGQGAAQVAQHPLQEVRPKHDTFP